MMPVSVFVIVGVANVFTQFLVKDAGHDSRIRMRNRRLQVMSCLGLCLLPGLLCFLMLMLWPPNQSQIGAK